MTLLLNILIVVCRSTLVAESFVGGKITMRESASVNATVWETLEKLGDKEVRQRVPSILLCTSPLSKS